MYAAVDVSEYTGRKLRMRLLFVLRLTIAQIMSCSNDNQSPVAPLKTLRKDKPQRDGSSGT